MAFDIVTDSIVFEGIKLKSRPVYINAWKSFRSFFDEPEIFNRRMPTELEFLNYFRSFRRSLDTLQLHYGLNILWLTLRVRESMASLLKDFRELPH